MFSNSNDIIIISRLRQLMKARRTRKNYVRHAGSKKNECRSIYIKGRFTQVQVKQMYERRQLHSKCFFGNTY